MSQVQSSFCLLSSYIFCVITLATNDRSMDAQHWDEANESRNSFGRSRLSLIVHVHTFLTPFSHKNNSNKPNRTEDAHLATLRCNMTDRTSCNASDDKLAFFRYQKKEGN